MKHAVLAGLVFLGLIGYRPADGQQRPSTPPSLSQRAFLDQYCVGCHNDKLKTGNLTLDKLDVEHMGDQAEVWEKVLRKLRAGMMPPAGARRPDRVTEDKFVATLAGALDKEAAVRPNPGATVLHRLNRTEYGNAIHDLLDLEVDVSTLLPADDSSEGFDNVADALGVSPALLDRYVAASAKISRLAVGDPSAIPTTSTYRVPGGLSQDEHLDGMPLGTRGGTLIRHNFPLDAEYVFKIRAGGGNVFGLAQRAPGGARDEQVEVTLNGTRVGLYNRIPPELRLTVKAGPQSIGIVYTKEHNSQDVNDLWKMIPPRPRVSNVVILGPFNATGSGDTPSRRRIFVCRPAAMSDEVPCAKKILSALARQAYRQDVTAGDLETLLSFYQSGKNESNFEGGIEFALQRILIDPKFVFRFEWEPDDVPAGTAYKVSDVELASRLSFFLWSSIPDDELLDLATQGKLGDPKVLDQQVRRMLKDPRSQALVTNFAGQWLFLRELRNARPDTREFDENLRESFRRETEMFFNSIIREDRNALDLLNADYTFVDERLARHYGIPNVHGSRFRRVPVTNEARKGLLGQGSILLVTSVANRTSPVQRGKWILENLLGVPAPAPPPNVPTLKEASDAPQPTSVRQRLEQHRANPTCASCHKIMDPIGFSLENFDLIGKWRDTDDGVPIDTSAELVDGTKVNGPASFRQALLSRPDAFITTMTTKLLTYAVGRPIQFYDMPEVRSIIRDASRNDYRFSSFVLGIVNSGPFRMKIKKQSQDPATVFIAADH